MEDTKLVKNNYTPGPNCSRARNPAPSDCVTLISLVALGTLFGFLGMLLATPLTAVFLVLVRRDDVEGVLERRHAHRPA